MASLSPLAVLIVFNLAFFHGSSELLYEDGYTVTTVLDGNKLNINPRYLFPRPLFKDLILLDSSSSRFYTVSLPLFQDSVIKEFAGNGMYGFSDGDASSAKFNKPRNFAVDLKGNVYVADRNNLAVRKISNSGTVTTIAGGCSKTPGHADGPGRNASFSSDYELTFVPDVCALLISDHGHKLIRQINLKQEDCVHSESGVGATVIWPWIMAVVVSCLMGLVIGFAIRPCIRPHGEVNFLNISKSWMHYLMNLAKQTLMSYSGRRNAVASPAFEFMKGMLLLFLSHLSLLLAFVFKRAKPSYGSLNKYCNSLLDSDLDSSSECVSSQKYEEQFRGLISFSGEKQMQTSEVCTDGLNDLTKDEDRRGHIDDLLRANMTNFDKDACKSSALQGPFLGVSTVVKRK